MPEIYDNKYRFAKDLGEGGFGKVFLGHLLGDVILLEIDPECEKINKI